MPAGVGGGYEPPESRMDFDPEAARLELAKAGYPEGKGFPEFTLLYNTSEGHKKYAEFVTSQWRAHLNINAVAMNLEWRSYLEKQTALDFVVCRAGWIADYNDPGTFLDMWVTKGGNNKPGWGDPFYDRLIHLAADPFRVLEDPDSVLSRCKERRRMDERLQQLRAAPVGERRLAAAKALRFQLFREAEAVLIEDAFPIIPLYSHVNSNLAGPRLLYFRTRLLRPDGTSADNLEDLHPIRDLVVEPRAGDGR